MGCLDFFFKQSQNSTINDRIATANERNAFNMTNRNFSIDMIKYNVNDAALLFLKEYGKLPESKEDEAAARHLFVNMVAWKAAFIANVEFKRLLMRRKKISDYFFLNR